MTVPPRRFYLHSGGAARALVLGASVARLSSSRVVLVSPKWGTAGRSHVRLALEARQVSDGVQFKIEVDVRHVVRGSLGQRKPHELPNVGVFVADDTLVHPLPEHLDPRDVEFVLLQILAIDSKAIQMPCIEHLAEAGTEKAIGALIKIAESFMEPSDLKAAAGHAMNRILQRQGGLKTGGLSLTGDESKVGGVTMAQAGERGAVSLTDSDSTEE